MANTTSLAWPSMFDVSRNCVSVIEDNVSVVNRDRLLLLTEPTELYNNPTFGVGLKRYLWQYNTQNTAALIKDRICQQLDEHEPCVDAYDTSFADGLLFTGDGEVTMDAQDYNRLKMTVGLKTIYNDIISIDLNFADLQQRIDYTNAIVNE